MLVDDALKQKVRNHLANWKTLRGGTPFYSGMIWPPLPLDEPQAVQEGARFIEIPDINLHLNTRFSLEDVLHAEESYPEHVDVLAPLKAICEYAPTEHAPERLSASLTGTVTVDLVLQAYQDEEYRQPSCWRPESVLQWAQKLKEFSCILKTPVGVFLAKTPVASFQNGKVARKRSLLHSSAQTSITKMMQIVNLHSTPSSPIFRIDDCAAIAADIGSQGYDAIFLTDKFESTYCVTGASIIKSIREMQKHLAAELSDKIVSSFLKRYNHRTEQFHVRPLVDPFYGLRVFVVDGSVAAATVQRQAVEPSTQTLPFTGEIGTKSVGAASGAYRTVFQETRLDSDIFNMFLEKASLVAADLSKAGARNYTLDMLLDDEENFTIDVFDLVNADYFTLSPTVIAEAMKASVVRSIVQGNEWFDTEELFKLASIHTTEQAGKMTLSFQERGPQSRPAPHQNDIAEFARKLEMIGGIRQLLLKTDATTAARLEEPADTIWLAEMLAILDERRDSFDVAGFVAAILSDLEVRHPRASSSSTDALMSTIPLLDAALWYRGKQAQTWKYCCNLKDQVMARPIDSGADHRPSEGLAGLPVDEDDIGMLAFADVDSCEDMDRPMNFALEEHVEELDATSGTAEFLLTLC